jgi:hypothetical protein
VHAHPAEVLGDGGEQRDRLDAVLVAQRPQRQRRVLATAPGERDGGQRTGFFERGRSRFEVNSTRT